MKTALLVQCDDIDGVLPKLQPVEGRKGLVQLTNLWQVSNALLRGRTTTNLS